MNPKLKLLGLVVFTTLLLFTTNLYVLALVNGILIFLVAMLRIGGRILHFLKAVSVVFIIIILIQSFTYSGLGFTYQGLEWGTIISLRLLSVLMLVFTFIFTTSPARISDAFGFLPKPMPFTMTLSLRLLPTVMDEYRNIINAQKARGMNFRTFNLAGAYIPLLAPLFAKTLTRAEKMALAMEARGFDSG